MAIANAQTRERQARAQQHRHGCGADQAADAEECVESRHDRPRHQPLDDDAVRVHRDVDGAERRTEDEQRRDHERGSGR